MNNSLPKLVRVNAKTLLCIKRANSQNGIKEGRVEARTSMKMTGDLNVHNAVFCAETE